MDTSKRAVQNMLQIVKMSREERVEMYMDVSHRDLAEMHVNLELVVDGIQKHAAVACYEIVKNVGKSKKSKKEIINLFNLHQGWKIL